MSPLFDDTDDDVTPRHAGGGASTGGRSAREYDREPAEREVTLNTGIVLALFFALALLCAVFFGFGYSIGHKSAPVPTVAAADSSTPVGAPASGSTSNSKPSPGTAAVPEYVPSGTAATAPSRPAVASGSGSTETQRQTPSADTGVSAVGKPAPVIRIPPPSADTPAMPATSPTGTTYVQVAAVSHPEDAEVLLSALRRRGYTVLSRTDATDHLIHVQIGPFSTRKDADTMRQKLLGDGYNAILK